MQTNEDRVEDIGPSVIGIVHSTGQPMIAMLSNTLPYLRALRDIAVETQNISELIREIETEINKTMENKG